jgi:hypothetical protein
LDRGFATIKCKWQYQWQRNFTIDLLTGGYAALDNFRIAASDNAGDVGDTSAAVPEPTTMLGIALAGCGLTYLKRRRSV